MVGGDFVDGDHVAEEGECEDRGGRVGVGGEEGGVEDWVSVRYFVEQFVGGVEKLAFAVEIEEGD